MLANTDPCTLLVFLVVAYFSINGLIVLVALLMKRDAERHGPKDFDDHPELKGPSER